MFFSSLPAGRIGSSEVSFIDSFQICCLGVSEILRFNLEKD